MQDGRVIAYISRKLRRHEENYATTENRIVLSPFLSEQGPLTQSPG
jgi:hypothetical protein